MVINIHPKYQIYPQKDFCKIFSTSPPRGHLVNWPDSSDFCLKQVLKFHFFLLISSLPEWSVNYDDAMIIQPK